MDDITAMENGAGYENGVHGHIPDREEQASTEKYNALSSCSLGNDGLTASSGDAVTSDDIEGVDSSASEVIDVLPVKEQNGSAQEELGVIAQAGLKDDKLRKVTGKLKNQNLSSPKNVTTGGLKKGKDAKNARTFATSNGVLVSESCSKEPVGLRQKSKSSNDKHTSDIRVNHSKSVPAATNVNGPKHSGQPQPTSPLSTVPHNDTRVEKAKLRLVKKSASSKSEATTQSSSPTSSEDRMRNVGALPAYNFSFRCDERAEKRREFYSKLEEKIQAKEAEKNNLQAKSKETQEAELRMLRKSLKFKATPMPSFYQEPAPPKTELKKIPPTRAKSPKLGRKKNSPNKGSEEENDVRNHPSRLSLDVNVTQSNIAKASPINSIKKPARKSLPKLPSQRTESPNEVKKPSARKTSLIKETIGSPSQQNKLSDELSGGGAGDVHKEDEAGVDSSQIQIDTAIEPVDESQSETTVVNNVPIIAGH